MSPADCSMLWQLPLKLLDFLAGIVIKNPPANAGDVRVVGSIPGLGRSSGVGNGNALQYSSGKIPWAEETGSLQSMGLQRIGHDSEYSLHRA